MDIIYIDGQDILTTWGLTPLYEKFYSSIMQFPDIKDRIFSDYEDEDGIKVYKSAGKVKSKEIPLSFGVDTYDHYLQFCNYMLNNPTFELSCFEVDKGIEYEYIAHTEFNYYKTGSSFGIKLREANFKNRTNIYLVTENNDYICTEDNNRIIL